MRLKCVTRLITLHAQIIPSKKGKELDCLQDCDYSQITYLCSRNHDTDLFNSLCELIGLDSAVIVEIKVLEGLKKNGLFIL